jgi:outer membrane immunogenic protein
MLGVSGKRLAIAAVLTVLGVSNANAQAAAPPPTLTAEDDNNCGWALGGAAAGLGVLALTAPKSTGPYNWTGFYAGGHLGCAWGDTDWTFANDSPFSNSGGSTGFDNDGWVAGGQIGYNYQSGQWVFGLEATLSAGDLEDQKVNVLNPAPAVNSTRLTADIETLLTVTARLGLAFDPRWLGYVKAGFASAEVETDLFIANAGASTSASASSRHNGWAFGAGLEYLLTRNIVLGLDYTYIDLEDKTYSPTCGPLACAPADPTVSVDPDIHMLTARVSFLFGAREAPAPLK